MNEPATPADPPAPADAPHRELFVYYRCPAGRDAEVRRAVESLHALLCARVPGLQARLLRRPEAQQAGLTTWMEVYAAPGGIGEALQAQIDRAATEALDGLREGARHTEVFVACA
ncbi:DUF4936 family protein [Piscinibacter sakaiensis]|uniref:DUF4936 domain-containing protein n=1 Tax=Piscinibacter sakaiensis TaxID=1547922 RepID=A0A0K8NWQ0_PISS1|nr:DUF4936 family protein [Piscinibacter sakaiensis]GAP34704.1 hypothetical protein ISF6_5412 [Piscinibacter sakaiensis]